MKRTALAVALALVAAPALARQPRTYQVTGEVTEVADDVIVVKKGKESFEIGRTPATRVSGDLSVGARVTVEYRMSATGAEAKAPKKK